MYLVAAVRERVPDQVGEKATLKQSESDKRKLLVGATQKRERA